MLTLRDYQQEAIAAVFSAEAREIRRPLIALPTGTGKTVIFASLIAQRPGRSLVLVHRDELIHQAHAKLKEINPALSIGIVKAEQDEHEAPCVIASVQTLSRERRLTRLTPDFQTLVVDEAHHAVADSYRRVLEYCRAFAENGPLTLGVTATPQRGDDVGLDAVFQQIIYSRTLREMILAGYLSDLRALQIRLKVDFHRLHTKMGDFLDGEIADLLLEANAPDRIVHAFLEHACDRKALLFVPTVKLAHSMAELFRQASVPVEALDGTTPPDERRAILKRLHSGETRVLANCGVLTEGFDESYQLSRIGPLPSPLALGRGWRKRQRVYQADQADKNAVAAYHSQYLLSFELGTEMLGRWARVGKSGTCSSSQFNNLRFMTTSHLVPTVPTLLLSFLKRPTHAHKYLTKQWRTRGSLLLASKLAGTVGTVGTASLSHCFYGDYMVPTRVPTQVFFSGYSHQSEVESLILC